MKKFISLLLVFVLCVSLTPMQDVQAAKKRVSKFVYVGDSRFVGMEAVKHGPRDVYIAKRSMGLEWLLTKAEEIQSHDSKTTVFIFGLGVNDLNNAFSYTTFVNNLGLRGKVYFCQVNPVDERKASTYGYSVTNNRIDSFNVVLKEMRRGYKILRTNKFLQKKGFSTTDGIHYTAETYKKIYRYCKNHATL